MEELIILGVAFAFIGGVFLWMFMMMSGTMRIASRSRRDKAANQMVAQIVNQLALARTDVYRRAHQLELLTGQLELSNEELARLNDMKSKFLSMVVHDVRTPLASIKGFGSLLETKLSGDKDSRLYVNYMISASNQLNKLITDLTDLAMIEAGKLKVEKAPFDYRVMVEELMPGIRINAQKKNINLIVNPGAAGLMVNGDKFRLSQVLMNLANNAVKFTPAGGTVAVTVAPDGRNTLKTSVRDSGPGIHPSETKLIFQKFYQSKHQKDAGLRKMGWGLGLCIASEIIQGHKGVIAVDSKGLGKGSTFWFSVPIK